MKDLAYFLARSPFTLVIDAEHSSATGRNVYQAMPTHIKARLGPIYADILLSL